VPFAVPVPPVPSPTGQDRVAPLVGRSPGGRQQDRSCPYEWSPTARPRSSTADQICSRILINDKPDSLQAMIPHQTGCSSERWFHGVSHETHEQARNSIPQRATMPSHCLYALTGRSVRAWKRIPPGLPASVAAQREPLPRLEFDITTQFAGVSSICVSAAHQFHSRP
jgi:hypothetical protein